MADAISGQKIANQLSARLSLRRPQRESLQVLVEVLDQLPLGKEPDLQHWLQVIRQHYASVQAFERDFPSLCFALATGVGKTRLMGAMIAWLFISGRSRHFLVLAPNLTIYEKLKRDFTLGQPKYVFAGIPEMAGTPPVVITGEDYEDGRGVRLDYAVPAMLTGDLFGADSSLHINIFNISKINARDNKQGANKSTTAKVRRLQEYLGQSYFEYLAELPDLVVLMDEAHRYYASAGLQAINDLRPVLGLELTATPKTTGAKPRPFRNVAYHYPLSCAMRDGYVKIPAVATRRDFRSADYAEEALERIKLEDGIHHHEFVKVELENHARSQQVPLVKPFMLVVAQDTAHAASIRAHIESDAFFAGRYRGRVIEVHSNLSGEESDESMQRLLAVEHDEHTEIVIHVNKLKEGWDVTNLYTIVPLRASASEILTEQTIGRGLRLPYGKRTGVDAVDRLCIIAHDRFQEIIDRANAEDSLIHEKIYIGDAADADVPDRKPEQIESRPLQVVQQGAEAVPPTAENSGRYQITVACARQAAVAETAIEVVQAQARQLSSSQQLTSPEVQARLNRQVMQTLQARQPQQQALAGMEVAELPTAEEVAAVVRAVAEKAVELTIDIPQITILPSREVTYGFNDFDLQGLERIRYQPVAQEMLLRHLESNRSASIQWGEDGGREEIPENYLVRHLFERDEVDYDQYAGLLYKLAGQVVGHLRSYLQDAAEVENVLLYWQKQLSEFIWAQMQAMPNRWVTPCDYYGKRIAGCEVLRPASFILAAGQKPRDFRAPVEDRRLIRQMVFAGFQRCCFPYQKFDSVDGEWRLAQILEDDATVLRWMKPACGQFRIEYQDGRNYEPDFVVETSSEYLLIEPKRADQLQQPEVQDKARAAVRWCQFANQPDDSGEVGNGKRWSYLLVPDDRIELGMSLARLKAEFVLG